MTTPDPSLSPTPIAAWGSPALWGLCPSPW